MTDLSRFQNPRFARAYDRVSLDAERRGTAEHRDHLLAGLSGRVLELGAGNGLNFAHYPTGVTEVVAVEPENQLRAIAERRAEGNRVPVRVVAGHADALPVEDASVDAAVASLVLCTVPDVQAALAELRRVLRPGGELRFFEHVRSTNRVIGVFQSAITPLWARSAGGCHLDRDTADLIAGAGFAVERLDRFTHSPSRFVPAHAHVLGTARAPAG